jgi:hypothetical protein
MAALPLARTRRSHALPGLGLGFATGQGPLVGVVGLCGGAGASTLCWLLACASAREGQGEAVCCEPSTRTGALALYARAQARGALAAAARAGAPLGALLERTAEGPLLLCSAPAGEDDPVEGLQLARLLDAARQRAGMVILDLGAGRGATERLCLALCEQVLWVAPASRSGLARAQRALALRAGALDGRQALILRADAQEPPPTGREIASLAQRAGLPVVLVPHLPDAAHIHTGQLIAEAQLALQAIAGVLRSSGC